MLIERKKERKMGADMYCADFLGYVFGRYGILEDWRGEFCGGRLYGANQNRQPKWDSGFGYYYGRYYIL